MTPDPLNDFIENEWLPGLSNDHTRHSYRSAWRSWAAFLRDRQVKPNQANGQACAAWVQVQQAQGLAPATIALNVSALASAYMSAARRGLWRGPNPAQGLRPVCPQPVDPACYTLEQARTLLGCVQDGHLQSFRDYALLFVLLATGMDLPEALDLRLADLTDLPPGVQAAGRAWLGAAGRAELDPQAWLFIALGPGGHYRPSQAENRLTPRQAARVLTKYSQRAGLPPATIHCLRLTHAALRLESGDSASEVCAALGSTKYSKRKIIALQRRRQEAHMLLGK